MATRKATRKAASRKAERKSSRKASSRKAERKTMKGGKRTEWMKRVMETYREMKRRDPKTRLGDAMKEAAKRK